MDQVLNIVNAVRKKPVAPEQVRPDKFIFVFIASSQYKAKITARFASAE
jgi:hypothetical protein